MGNDEELTRDDFEFAMLKGLCDIQDTLKIMAEFQERLGEAIEMLARAQGYEFTILEDKEASA